MSWEHLRSYIEAYGEKYSVLSTQHQVLCIILEVNPSAPDEPLDNCNPSDILTTTSWEVLSHSCPTKPLLNTWPTESVRDISVQFSHSVMSDSVQPHEPQHTRPPCPSPTPGVDPNSCSLSQWYHLTISSSVVPFSSCLQSFPTSGSFQMSQLFAWGGQSIGVSASTSVLPMNTQDWFPLGWTDWDLLAVQGTLKSLLQQHSSKASILQWSAFFIVQLSSIHDH